jgi:hypothetical protein
MIIIGIDPGLTGAIAFLDTMDGRVHVEDMPTIAIPEAGPKTTIKTEVDVIALDDLVQQWIPPGALAFMEHTSSVGQVGQEQAKLSLAAGKASCLAVLRLAGVTVHRVTPVAWKRFYGIKEPMPGSKGLSQKKQALKLARDLYGVEYLKLEKHHNRADALLIARWGQRHFCDEPARAADPLDL